MDTEILEKIECETKRAEKLLESVTDANSKQNRDKIHKAYNRLFRVNNYIKKLKGGTKE